MKKMDRKALALQREIERPDQAPGREVIRRERGFAECYALAVDRGLNGQSRSGEANGLADVLPCPMIEHRIEDDHAPSRRAELDLMFEDVAIRRELGELV